MVLVSSLRSGAYVQSDHWGQTGRWCPKLSVSCVSKAFSGAFCSVPERHGIWVKGGSATESQFQAYMSHIGLLVVGHSQVKWKHFSGVYMTEHRDYLLTDWLVFWLADSLLHWQTDFWLTPVCILLRASEDVLLRGFEWVVWLVEVGG